MRGCIVALMAAGIKHPRACTTTVVYSATIYVDNFEMESDTRYRVPAVVRQRSGSTCKVWEKRGGIRGREGRTGWIRGSFWSCKEGGSVRVGREETSRVENKIQAESFAS